jgi:hypothetical protein
MNTCAGCLHAPSAWRELSQLPTCAHPRVWESTPDAGPVGIWQLYATGDRGFCGPQRTFFGQSVGGKTGSTL